MNKQWIQQNLDRLSTSCPCVSGREFAPTKNFYDRLFQAAEHDSFIQELCFHVGIQIIPEIEVVGDSEVPILDLQAGLRFFDKVIDSAGDYKQESITPGKIRIGASHLRHVHKFGHILAHEIAHHYLRLNLVHPTAEDEAEMFTDLTAIYLGFGKLMLNGAADEPLDFVQE